MTPGPVVTVTLNPAIDQTLRIPGFAAGRVNRVAASRSDAGGKGINVASFLADLGVAVIATGFLGEDNAALFESFLAHKGIPDRFIRLLGSTRVGIKIVDERTQETTDINFPGLAASTEDVARLKKRIVALAFADRWFVVSGSLPPGVQDGIYAALIDVVRGRGGHVVLDTSGPALRAALASRPEVIKPNLEELRELSGRDLSSPREVCAAARSLLSKGLKMVAVSMGGAGAVFVDGERALLARPPAVAVRSTVGAGDAMVAGIVHALLQGLPLADLARVATASGAYAVTQVGSGIADPDEHRRLIGAVEIVAIEPLEV